MRRSAAVLALLVALLGATAASADPTTGGTHLRECRGADGYLVVENMTCWRGGQVGRKFWRRAHVETPPPRVLGFRCNAVEVTIYCKRGQMRLMWERDP